jgi:hypothetical protein
MLLLPWLALGWIAARGKGGKPGGSKLRKLQFGEEFGFERAVEAYEAAIDATLAERRA